MNPIQTLSICAPPQTALIDSHIHLDSQEYLEDWRQLLDRAKVQGVQQAVVPATDLASSERILQMAREDNRILPAIGIHPHQAASFTAKEAIAALTPEAVALGETGLELHYDFCPLEPQLVNLRAHLELARETGLPLILHCREAEEVLHRELSRFPGLHGVVHCFTGPWEWGERFLELGYHLGVTGMVTYPKLVEVHEVARRCPLDRLLVETDGPYLAPIPYRGKRNEPGTIPAVAQKVAELREMDPAELARAVTANTLRLFARERRTSDPAPTGSAGDSP